jgi:hypothetical protein
MSEREAYKNHRNQLNALRNVISLCGRREGPDLYSTLSRYAAPILSR